MFSFISPLNCQEGNNLSGPLPFHCRKTAPERPRKQKYLNCLKRFSLPATTSVSESWRWLDKQMCILLLLIDSTGEAHATETVELFKGSTGEASVTETVELFKGSTGEASVTETVELLDRYHK